jgi:hypothetical protein
MDDIIGLVLLLGVLFGCEIVAIFILIMSALYGRQLVFVILCGIVATVVMAVESLILFLCSAASSDFPASATLITSALSIVCLGIYFPVAVMRCKRKPRSDAPNAA